MAKRAGDLVSRDALTVALGYAGGDARRDAREQISGGAARRLFAVVERLAERVDEHVEELRSRARRASNARLRPCSRLRPRPRAPPAPALALALVPARTPEPGFAPAPSFAPASLQPPRAVRRTA